MKLILVTTDREKNLELKGLGSDMLEVRVDLLKNVTLVYAAKLMKLRQRLGIPLLLTVRNDKKEGAKRVMPDAKKWALLSGLMPLCDWVDIELSSPLCKKTIGLAHSFKKKAVVSVHDFKETPSNIEAVYRKAMNAGGDAVKFAFHAKRAADLHRLIVFTLKHKKENIITMAVGPWGPLSRIILPDCGSRWVYTFLKHSTAPGQLDIKSLRRFL